MSGPRHDSLIKTARTHPPSPFVECFLVAQIRIEERRCCGDVDRVVLYGPSGSERAGTRIVGCSLDKPMLFIVARGANGYKAEGFSRQRVFIHDEGWLAPGKRRRYVVTRRVRTQDSRASTRSSSSKVAGTTELPSQLNRNCGEAASSRDYNRDRLPARFQA